MLRMGLGMAVVLAPLQALIGDLHGLKTLEYQPAKIAAIEAHWDGEKTPVPLVLFAWPDEAAEENRYEIAGALSRQPHPDALAGRRGAGPEGIRGRGPAAGDACRSSRSG